MKKIMMLVGAAAMAVTMPAMAEAQGKSGGKGNAAKAQSSVKGQGQARTNARAQSRAAVARNAGAASRVDANRNGILDRFERDSDGDGILDYREGRVQRSVDRNGNGILDRFESGRRMNFCPPGLAKKTPACIPPGQAKRMFNQGQRVPTNFRGLTDFDDLSPQLRDRLPAEFRSDNFDFIVRDNTIFVVDPTTRVVRSIIELLTR